MKKVLLALVILIGGALGGAYYLLFTKGGNELLRPYIQNELQKKLPIPVRLERFTIAPTDILLKLGEGGVVQIGGDFSLASRSLDLTYDVRIKDLADLKPLIGADLRGPFSTKGKVSGPFDKIVVEGTTPVAGSKSSYRAILDMGSPQSVEATIRGAKLAKILYMLKMPIYADASIDSDITLTNLDPEHLAGRIDSKVRNGATFAKVLKKEFDLDGATIHFKADQHTVVSEAVATNDIALHTNIADLKVAKAKVYLASGKVDAPYTLTIPDLSRLYFLTKQRMRGRITLHGKVQKDRDLLVTAHSNTLGGTVDVRLLNNKVRINAKNVEVTAITDIFLYPRIFTSKLIAQLDYNILTKRGKLEAKALNGQILPNKMSFLLQQMANFDITKEVYKETKLVSDINDKRIVSDLDMRSRLTHISTKKALMDLRREYMDAKLAIDIKGNPVYVKLKGNLRSPKVSLDAGSMLKQRAKKEVEKRLKGKVPADAQKLLNNLF